MTDNILTNNFLADAVTLFLDRRVPWVSKLLFVGGAAAYFLLPIDIIPDFLPPLGIIDDGGAILVLTSLFTHVASRQLESKDTLSEEIDNEGKQVYVSQKSGRWGFNEVALGCLAFTGIMALILTTGVAVALLSGVWTLNTVISSIGGFFGQPTTATIIPSRTIVTSLKPLGQLVSISVEVAQADIHVGVNTGGINLCGHSAKHVAQGAVEAGVDITKVDEDNILYDEASDMYTLTLPSPSITSCRVDYIRQYERSGASVACAADWDAIRMLAQHEAINLFVEDTLEADIISRAERETTLLMESFISALTGSDVKVVYDEPDEETQLPASCQPQLPRGWAFDETQNTWVRTE